MIKRIKTKKALFPVISFLLSFPLFSVYAQEVAPLSLIFERIADWLFNFLVYGAIIGVVMGAITILFSGGEPAKVTAGRQIVLYSLVAVLVGLFARVVVMWVISIASL